MQRLTKKDWKKDWKKGWKKDWKRDWKRDWKKDWKKASANCCVSFWRRSSAIFPQWSRNAWSSCRRMESALLAKLFSRHDRCANWDLRTSPSSGANVSRLLPSPG